MSAPLYGEGSSWLIKTRMVVTATNYSRPSKTVLKSPGPWSLGSVTPIWNFPEFPAIWNSLSGLEAPPRKNFVSKARFKNEFLTQNSLSELLRGPRLWSACQHPTQDSRFSMIQTKAPFVCAAQLSHWLRCPWPQDSLPVSPLEINALLETCCINRIDLCNHPLKRCCWWPSRSWILKRSSKPITFSTWKRWSVLIISSMSIAFCVIA